MYDPTIRVPKLPSGPVRTLPRKFARERPSRWPYLVAAVVAVVAVAVTPLALHRTNDRSEQAQEVLRSLGR